MFSRFELSFLGTVLRVRRPRETRPYRPCTLSPLWERVGVRGRKARSRPFVPYTRGVMPVLPVPTRSKILPFEAQGKLRMTVGTGRTPSLPLMPSLSFSHPWQGGLDERNVGAW